MRYIFTTAALFIIVFFSGYAIGSYTWWRSLENARTKVMNGTHVWRQQNWYPIIVPVVKPKLEGWNVTPHEELKKRKTIREWERGKLI